VADPSWAPSLEQVADHIPTRTRDAAVPGDTRLPGTFSSVTEPTDEQARRHIASAVVEVLAAVGGVVPTLPLFLGDLASAAAALRAAASIELAYPNRDADVSVFTQLDQRATAALARLVEAVSDQGAGPEGGLLPQYSFPEPAWWGDYPL
jgi:hypothetical protein